MDIEKLIEQLRWWADHCDRTNYGCHARTFLLDAATALTTLWDENERLRTKLQKSEHDNVNLTGELAKVAAELEQVKREREELEAALRREQDG
jgi:chromosome segregation ATPase